MNKIIQENANETAKRQDKCSHPCPGCDGNCACHVFGLRLNNKVNACLEKRDGSDVHA